MTARLFLFIFSFLVFQSCNVGTSGIWKNNHIDAETTAEIKLLNDKLFKAIANNDPSDLNTILSDSLLQQGAGIKDFINQVHNVFLSKSYKILDEYYVSSSTTGLSNTIPGVAGDNSYVINYFAVNKEMFVSLLMPTEQENEALILAIYGKHKNVWKLNILKVGQYSLFKKNSIDYYKIAKSYYEKHNLLDAYININLSERLLRPVNDIFIFQKENEINSLTALIKTELNTKFPLPFAMDKISTAPKMFGISPEMSDEGFCPLVQYLTDINLKDTTLLKGENEKMKEEIKKLFSGVEKNNKYIFFRAFNKLPGGPEPVQHYGFIDHLRN